MFYYVEPSSVFLKPSFILSSVIPPIDFKTKNFRANDCRGCINFLFKPLNCKGDKLKHK